MFSIPIKPYCTPYIMANKNNEAIKPIKGGILSSKGFVRVKIKMDRDSMWIMPKYMVKSGVTILVTAVKRSETISSKVPRFRLLFENRHEMPEIITKTAAKKGATLERTLNKLSKKSIEYNIVKSKRA